MKIYAVTVILLLSFFVGRAQSGPDQTFKWWNPAKESAPMVDGQMWPKEVANFYDRFPARAEKSVRKEVWALSRNAAGLKLRFRTNAKSIRIRYAVVAKNYAMDHFPATGKSGIDLYSANNDGSWAWASPKYKFADTISYEYGNIDLDTRNYSEGREYMLYLPIYNTLRWIEIGVPEKSTFTPIGPRAQKPVVVYGTSIAQGGCASRPGMAWTAIMERDLNVPVVNLAFSGNGRLEKEVTALVDEIDASVFVLDCLPNLTAYPDSASAEVQGRITAAVKTLRAKHPNTPIVLTDHSGFIENRLDYVRRRSIQALNDASAKAFKTLQADGIKGVYVLPATWIALGADGTVDGTHPSDLGMYRYAMAYEKLLAPILKKRQ